MSSNPKTPASKSNPVSTSKTKPAAATRTASATSTIPLAYRLFFLYIEPVSAIVGSYYAAGKPSEYLAYLTAPPGPVQDTAIHPLPTATRIALYQLSNLYLLFALNEHLVLSSTTALRTWRCLLLGLLVADLGHLATMVPLAQEKGFVDVFVRFWGWDAMEWGSVGFVYVGATMRSLFLLGVGLRGTGTGTDASTAGTASMARKDE